MLPFAHARPTGPWKDTITARSKWPGMLLFVPHAPDYLSLKMHTRYNHASSWRFTTRPSNRPSLLTRPLHLRPIGPHLNSDSPPTCVCFNPYLVKCNGAVCAHANQRPRYAVHRLYLAVWKQNIWVVDDGVVLSDLSAVAGLAHELGWVEADIRVRVLVGDREQDAVQNVGGVGDERCNFQARERGLGCECDGSVDVWRR
jgi:hypothetical protein